MVKYLNFSNFMLSMHKLNMEISVALNQYMNICSNAADPHKHHTTMYLRQQWYSLLDRAVTKSHL